MALTLIAPMPYENMPYEQELEARRLAIRERQYREREARKNEMYKGVRMYKEDGDMYSKEYCDLKKQEIQERIDTLKIELAHCETIIKEKWKGYIRSAQKERRELKDSINTLILSKQPWFNGGIW